MLQVAICTCQVTSAAVTRGRLFLSKVTRILSRSRWFVHKTFVMWVTVDLDNGLAPSHHSNQWRLFITYTQRKRLRRIEISKITRSLAWNCTLICNDPAGQCWNQYSGWSLYKLRHRTMSVARLCFVRVFLVGQDTVSSIQLDCINIFQKSQTLSVPENNLCSNVKLACDALH